MIKRLLVCLFLLVPITAQAEIVKNNPPTWIIKCWIANDPQRGVIWTFNHYIDNSKPSFTSENWIQINETKTGEWTWIFTFGSDLICKSNKVLE